MLVYNPCEPASLDMLAGIKSDIDKNKDKKEVRPLTVEILVDKRQLIKCH